MGLLIFMPLLHTLCTSRVHEACTWQAWPCTGTRSKRAGSEPPGREDDRGSLEAGRTQGIRQVEMRTDEQTSRRKMDGKSEKMGGREEMGRMRMRVQLDPSRGLSEDPRPWLAAFPSLSPWLSLPFSLPTSKPPLSLLHSY